MRPYYEDASVQLFHADCREVLPYLQGVDHVLTDPPYTSITHAGARTSKGGVIHAQEIDFDAIDNDVWFVPILLRLARRWVIAFCALEQLYVYQQAAGVDQYVRSGVWRRHSGPQFSGDRPAQAAEGLAIMHRAGRKRWSRGGESAVWEVPVVTGVERQHPTQKPQLLVADLVSDFSDGGELILDPFAGSGTTLIAAKRLGRRAIGIEKEERYCEVAAKRLSQGALELGFSTSLRSDPQGDSNTGKLTTRDLFSEP